MAHYDINGTSFDGSGNLEVDVQFATQGFIQASPNSEPDVKTSKVEVVTAGQDPTQDFWVHKENHHLTLYVDYDGQGAINHHEIFRGLGYYRPSGVGTVKSVDIVVWDKPGGNPKVIRRNAVTVSDTGG